MRRSPSLVAVLVLALAGTCGLLGPVASGAAGSGTVPATSGTDKASEAARQRHQKILTDIGRYDDERVQQYVNEIGQRIAAKSDRPDLTYTFTVLDSDQVNAFADPGGYIYVCRGLLAYLNSEAELAAVLGHEIGHVTARHSAHRQAGAVAANVGTALVGILTGNPGLMDVANMAGGALVMGYSRAQESESDALGMKFVTRAGYDPSASVDSLRVLWNYEQLRARKARDEKQGASGGGLFASHPDIDKRVRDAEAMLSGTHANAGDQRPANQDGYYANIDGLVYGTNAAQGVVRGSRFYHANMGVTMAFPSGWKVDNQPSKLLATTPERDKVIDVSAQPVPPNMTPQAFLGQLTRGQSSSAAEPLEVNGLSGYRATLRSASMPWGGTGPASVAVIYYNGLAYIFTGATRIPTQFGAFEPIFLSSIKTFRRLRDNEYAAAEPERIRVIQAGPDTQLAQLAQKSPLPGYQIEELQALNGLSPDQQPTPGQKLKIVE